MCYLPLGCLKFIVGLGAVTSIVISIGLLARTHSSLCRSYHLCQCGEEGYYQQCGGTVCQWCPCGALLGSCCVHDPGDLWRLWGHEDQEEGEEFWQLLPLLLPRRGVRVLCPVYLGNHILLRRTRNHLQEWLHPGCQDNPGGLTVQPVH